LTISKEIKVGVLGAVILFSVLYLFNYLKRHNAFSTNLIVTAHFDDVEFLKKGDLVYIKGREYGSVAAIYMKEGQRMVDLDIESDANIPTTAKAVITELSLLGGRMISIIYEGKCSGNCLESGAVIPGEVSTMKEQVAAFGKPLLKQFGTIADTLMGPGGMENMLAQAHSSLAGLAKTTKGLEKKMRGISKTLPGTIKGFREMTAGYLSTNNDELINAATQVDDEKMQLAIDSLIKNVASLTQEDIDAMTKMLYTLAEQGKTLPEKIQKGKAILVKADKGVDNLNAKIAVFEEGAQGIIPKMLYDADYKDSLVNKIQYASQKITNIRLHPEENLTLNNKK
jgi:hypothetical protein